MIIVFFLLSAILCNARLRRSCRIEFDHCKLYSNSNKMYSNSNKNVVYLYLDGQCRHIPNPKTFDNLFTSWSAVHQVSPNEWAHCNMGKSIENGAFLGRAHGRHEVYLFDNGKKRHIANSRTFKKCSFNWSKVKPLRRSFVDGIQTGHTVSEYAVKFPFLKRDTEIGQTLGYERRRLRRTCRVKFDHCKLYQKSNKHAVYLYLDGQCRHIPNLTTFANLFTSSGAVHHVSPHEWPHCNIGKPIANGAFLGQAHGRPEVYLFDNGQKRHIAHTKTMSKCSFNSRKIRLLQSSFVDGTRTGHTIY